MMNFKIIVNDSAANKESFPHADKLIIGDPNFEKSYLDEKSYVIILTQHKSDHIFIKKALKSNCRYIGLVASSKRANLVFQYLKEEGLSSKDLEKIYTPSGLDLGGITPEEIALSIISEMIMIRRSGTGKSLLTKFKKQL